MDLKLSYSRASTYLQCPYKYYLAYIVKLPGLPKPYFSFGHSLHSALEWFHKPKLITETPTLDDLLLIYTESWESEGYSSPTEEARARDEGKSLLIDYHRHVKKTWKPSFDVEKRFSIDIEGITVTGAIDRIDYDEENNSLELLDYKTGKWVPKSITDSDKFQLTIYAIASKRIWNKTVTNVSYLFLREMKYLSFAPSESDEQNVIEQLRYVRDGIENKDFERVENKFCPWCDYKDRCQTTKVITVDGGF